MPNTKSAKKRLKSSLFKRRNNRIRKSRIKTSETRFEACVVSGDKEAAGGALSRCFSELDRAAKKGAIHKRKADRKKERLAARLAAMP